MEGSRAQVEGLSQEVTQLEEVKEEISREVQVWCLVDPVGIAESQTTGYCGKPNHTEDNCQKTEGKCLRKPPARHLPSPKP